MSTYRATERTTVAASPQACFDALTDYDTLTRWQPVLRDVRVLERDEQGRGSVVEYELDAKVRRVRYRLRLHYDEPHGISSEYLEGDFSNFAAEWRFTDAGDGHTDVVLAVALNPGRFVPGPIRSRVQEFVVTRALRDLERHLDGVGVA